MKFTPEICEKLNYYVYRLIDPRNGETFYVGKGKGNRVFEHINNAVSTAENSNDDNEKLKRIREITGAGLEVIHIIHRYGLDEETAFEVEAAVIDCYPGLTNIKSGYCSERRVTNSEIIIKELGAAEYEEPEDIDYLIIKTTKAEVENCDGDLYEATRKSWRVSKEHADKVPYVFSVINGVVRAVYRVENWILSGTDRYEFIGDKADSEIWERFADKRIPQKYSQKGSANPVIYKK